MFIATATLPTAHASKYLGQLCKHFSHKATVEWDDHQGRAALPTGAARLDATPDALHVRIEAEDAKGLIQAKFVVDSHLVTFAFREDFIGFGWTTCRVDSTV